jgi:hypothetical protein
VQVILSPNLEIQLIASGIGSMTGMSLELEKLKSSMSQHMFYSTKGSKLTGDFYISGLYLIIFNIFIMRKFVRSAPFKSLGRSTQPAYNPEANDQRLKNWTGRLNNLATSQSSKVYLGQLGALVNYYNRVAVDSTKVTFPLLSPSTGTTGARA